MREGRRYQDEEIKEIFERAAESRTRDGRPSASGEGLTLRELQAIGAEVGLPPDRVEEAALAVDLRRGSLPRQTAFGMPISVGRVIELPRQPTEHEWDLVVSELRQTFKARGKTGGSGDTRHWSNGNLHAFVEPTEAGYRLRLGTTKGNAGPLNTVGLLGLGMALFLTVAFLLAGNPGDDLMAPIMFGGLGIGVLAWNALSLPRWAREREDQMEYIAARALALLSEPEGNRPLD